MDFLAIDVETANPDMASICQIGIAQYRDNSLVHEWSSFIDPMDSFSEFNISIHGIRQDSVKGAPTFKEISSTLYKTLENQVVVCHTHFDRVAILQASRKFGLAPPNCTWLDSARVARRTWEDFAMSGYGLHNLSKFLGYEFKHHDALEDAKAAGNIVLEASAKMDLDINGWIARVKRPISPENISSNSKITREGDPEGALFGEVIVFTGALEIPRKEAADMAAQLGCNVGSGVTKKTTILVVGDQDLTRLSGKNKSAKHRKAEDFILKGIPIRILKETDFKELVTQGLS